MYNKTKIKVEMIDVKERIEALHVLRNELRDSPYGVPEEIAMLSYQQNQWFTLDNIRRSIHAIADRMLNREALTDWASQYDLSGSCKKIGIVMAGNIPAVGFHDLLACIIAGHRVIYKTSSKDDILIPYLIARLIDIQPAMSGMIEKVQQLRDFDAVIATGSDTAATHFAYYFRNHPHLIRHNRNSVAVLSGRESQAEIKLLGKDMFDYFGLGCRNVSKLYIPAGYTLADIFTGLTDFHHLIDHNAFKNNFDYTFALYTLAQIPFLTNNVFILKEDQALAGRIGTIHYEFYHDIEDVKSKLNSIEDNIQCISTNIEEWDNKHVVAFGQCQEPGLMDYADGVDVMHFLTKAIYDKIGKS